jgi:hypothetical protein
MITAFAGGTFARTAGGTTLWSRGRPGENASSAQPFALQMTLSSGASPAPRVRVYASTLAGGSSTDIGFAEGDDPPYLLTPTVGVVQGGISIDGATGEVTSRWIEIVSELTPDDDTTFYVEIGTVAEGESEGTWLVSNSRFGPITATICRNWYAAEAPYFGVTWA